MSDIMWNEICVHEPIREPEDIRAAIEQFVALEIPVTIQGGGGHIFSYIDLLQADTVNACTGLFIANFSLTRISVISHNLSGPVLVVK